MKEIKNVVQNYHLFGFFQVGFQINGDKVSLSGDSTIMVDHRPPQDIDVLAVLVRKILEN